MLRYFPFQQLSVLQRRAGEGVGDQARYHQEKQERTIIIKLPVRPMATDQWPYIFRKINRPVQFNDQNG